MSKRELEFELHPPTGDELDRLRDNVKHDIERAVARGTTIPQWLQTVMWLVEAYEKQAIPSPDVEHGRRQIVGPYEWVTAYVNEHFSILVEGEVITSIHGVLVEDYSEGGIVIDVENVGLLRVPREMIQLVRYWEQQPEEKGTDEQAS